MAKKIFSVLLVLVVLFSLIAPAVKADDGINFDQDLSLPDVQTKAGTLLKFVRTVVLILAVLAVILLGFAIVYNNEDPRVESEVKRRLLFVGVGVTIIALAVGIITFVFKTFSNENPFSLLYFFLI